MKLLIDTHDEPFLAILNDKDQESARQSWTARTSQREIVSQLDELLQKAKLKLTDIDHLILNLGPGSFTGTRLAVSLALGLAYANQLPIFTYQGNWLGPDTTLTTTSLTALRPIYASLPHITPPR